MARARHSDQVTFSDVLAIGVFRRLWLAEAQSNMGDQLARVALTILVYQRTGSAAWTASSYALTFLPALFGGVVLSRLADRHPRRSVMVGSDLARALLLVLMAVPGMPLAVIAALLVPAVAIGPAFTAAQAAVLPDLLTGEYYTVANALRSLSNQVAQLAGFAVGGVLIAAIGPRAGLLLDGLTFAISAGVLQRALAGQPAARERVSSPPSAPARRTARAAAATVMADARLRSWLGLVLLVGVYVIPEGVAAPLATSLHGGSATIGLLMAAAPAGTAIGAFAFVRVVSPHSRQQLAGPFAAATGLPMALFLLHPNTAAAVALLALSGLFTAYLIEATSSFTRNVPTANRGQIMGLAGSGLLVSQGAGLLLAGLISEHLGPNATIGLFGVIGTALAALLTVSLAHAYSGRPAQSATWAAASASRSPRHAVEPHTTR